MLHRLTNFYWIGLIIFLIPIRALAEDIELKMRTSDGSSKVVFQDASSAEVMSVDSKGRLQTSSAVVSGAYVSVPEISDPGPASANRARLYAKDIGGTTYIAYQDSSGNERILKPQLNVSLADAETASTNLGTTFKDVHWSLDTEKLSTFVVDFTGFTEARLVFRVKNSEADTIQCRAFNVTDNNQIVADASDGTANAQTVTSAWTPISLTGDKEVRGECREGTGATSDPDIGGVRLQLR